MSLKNILTGNHILMMPQGEGDGTSGPIETTATVNNRDAQKSIKDEAKDTLDITNQLVQAQITSTDQLKIQQKIMQDISEKMGDAYTAQQEFLNQAQINITDFSKAFQQLSADAELAGDKNNLLKESFKDLKGQNETLYKDLMRISEKFKDDPKKAKVAFEELKGELQLAQGVGKNFDKTTKSFAQSLGLAGSAANTTAGKLRGVVLKLENLNSEAAKEQFKTSFVNSMKESFGIFSILSSLFDNMIKSALEFDKASKSLESSFGQLGAFQSQLVMNNAELRRMGLNAGEQAKLVTGLANEFVRFTGETEANQEMLKTNAGVLQALGVSTSNTNKIIETMVVGMGRSAEESSRLTMNLASMGKAFGKTSEQMISDFASLSGNLAAYGDNMEKVFIGLQKEAKRTGITVSELNQLAESFDTFSGAAEKAAKLNALFGTNISAMTMNTMDADERLKELGKQMSRLNVDTMGRYEKLALKDALGLSSVAEAVKYLGGTLSTKEKEELKNIQVQKDMTETMNNLAKATLPLAKKLETMFSEITSNETTVNIIIDAMRMLSQLLIVVADNFVLLIPAYAGYIGVTKIVLPLLFATKLGFAGIAISSAAAFGAIGLLAYAFLHFSGVLHQKNSPELYLLFGIVAAGIFAIGISAQTTQPGLYALAAAALAVGLAVTGIFYSMSLAVDSLTGLFTVLSEGRDNFPIAAGGLHLMATGMIALGSASLIATSAITAALAGIGAITSFFSLSGSSVEDLLKAGEGMGKMGDGVEKFGSGLEKIKVVASELKNSLGETLISASMQGDKMSVLVGKEAAVATLFKNDTLNIKVDMPTINIPTPKFDVYLDGKIIKAKVEQRFNDK